MVSRRLVIAAAAGAALAGAIVPSYALTYTTAPVSCTGDPAQLQRVDFTVDGQPEYAIYAVPSSTPKGVVVFDHGYQNTPYAWQNHVLATAQRDGVIAVAVHYHGETDTLVTNPDGSIDPHSGSRGWRVQEGADDTVAAGKMFLDACSLNDTGTAVVFGISMGGNTSGLAVEENATRSNGKLLFDYWFDVEGATNVSETYNEARAVAPANAYAGQAQADIEQEMGGATFEQAPSVYAAHTVNARPSDLASSGLSGVVIVHGVGDGLVPHDQSRETELELRAAGIPVEFYAVGTKQAGTESGTTADGYVPVAHDSLLAGHGWEGSSTQTVIVTSFQRLDALFSGRAPVDSECAVAGDPTGTLTTGVASTC